MLTGEIQHGLAPRVVLSGALVGVPVVGSSVNGREWTVTSAAPGYTFTDPLAPLGVPITYRAGSESWGPVILESDVYNVLSLPDGSVSAEGIIPHEWADTTGTDAHVFETGRARYAMFGPGPVEGPSTFTFRTSGRANIDAVRAMVRGRRPVVFRHGKCPLSDCPVPPAIYGVLTGGEGRVTTRKDLAEMSFSLTLSPVRIPAAPVPLLTWGDLTARYGTWDDVKSDHATWADVRDGSTNT